MADQMLKTRIIHKHETEADWNKATNFIPLLGELIVYDSDSNYPYARMKIGDGETVVTELPFAGSSIELDTTLTQSGVAADAAAVGERIQKGGTKAFLVISIDDTNKTITLDSVEGLEVGYLCSAIVTNNYNAFGTITAITNTTVTFDNIPTNYTIDEESCLWVPEHPELGTQETGSYSAKVGYNNKANGMASFATGQDNIADGKRSFASGRRNYAGYGAAVVGQDNKAFGFFGLTAGDHNTIYGEANNTFTTGAYNQLRGYNGMANGEYNWVTGRNGFVTGQNNTTGGQNSFVGGVGSETYHDTSFLFGEGLATYISGQTLFGKFNRQNANDLLQIGVGTSKGDRRNAFVVDKNSNIASGYNPSYTGLYNITSGDTNVVKGNNNIVSGASNNITGSENIVSGRSHGANLNRGYIGGSFNQTYSTSSNVFMHGQYLWATADDQAAFGRYNTSAPDLIFTVGIGTADNARSNGLAVTVDGRATVARDPIYNMDVATKQYVDSQLNNFMTAEEIKAYIDSYINTTMASKEW